MPACLTVPLERRQIHTVRDAADWRIACRAGAVWITVDGDSADYVLEPGESLVTSRHARALVYALGTARVDLVARQSRKPLTPRFSRFQSMPLTNAAR